MAAVASSSSSPHPHAPLFFPMQPAPHQPPQPSAAQFALAEIKGHVCLVQAQLTPQGQVSAALAAADVHVFAHVFSTQFRFSHAAAVHPADLRIIAPVPAAQLLHEEHSGVVFLARELNLRLHQLQRQRQHQFQHQHQQGLRRPRAAGQVRAQTSAC
ncbi:hypothetical protein IEO21_03000 [Rhodonia placenta]|uniref:Uncharacterized protein n=1 Tax=Rhodonia placenta TaxID=104341 RepID=A0A8H7P6H9_9APHY|nr:hypothetical protein IEO21_03000 [Postia placenta]